MATQTVQTVSDIPKPLESFYTTEDTGLIPRGVAEIFRPYEERYAPLIQSGLVGAGTVAPMSQAQQAVGQRLETMGLPAAFAEAQRAGETAAGAYQGIPGVVAPELTQYQVAAPERFQAPQMTGAQMGLPQQFTSEIAQQYMDPYMQGVVDIQQRKAIDAARQAQLSQNLGASRQGTYGGARQAILESQREAGLRQQMGDIQAQGLQQSYSQAQQQFERDRGATMQAQFANLSNEQQAAVQNLASQLQTQGLTAQQALQAALANQQAALGVQQLGAGQSLEAQRANQASQLQGAAGLAGLAQTMGGLGTQQLAGELDITKTMGAYGDLQRALAQQQMDAERGYMQQMAEYGMTQVGDLSNLLRGIPMTDTTQTVSTPPPSFASQLTGLGLTGVSLYNLLGAK
jgi:hypothetical protein